MAVVWDGLLYGAHLDKNPLTPNYPLWGHGEILEDTEIVESQNWEKLK